MKLYFRGFRRACFGVKSGWSRLEKLASREIKQILTELPEPLSRQAQMLTVIFQRVPDTDMQTDGIESDPLGLFVGSKFVDDGNDLLPPQIVLYLVNLWHLAGGHEIDFCDQVRTTFLHELGHYLGLDEKDLTERGLD